MKRYYEHAQHPPTQMEASMPKCLSENILNPLNLL
jgi:hypothetical protein